ncbi:hypothetical protein B5C02_08310 [Staphylococcus pseudintermedius]|uniref:hypothetical protein n=1 Tax=Staphylococcus pseudintermedius TaxID=283734 RepID=UPI000BBB74E0|nr:hypothetical protein [Staphylococcus pseudintermedius]PCF66304.1 hypothetical protein B5C02_08310 [Staphylococcus pseudintermedius]
MIEISTIKIKQFFLWFLAYFPIFMIIVFRALNNSWIYPILFLFSSILIYFVAGKVYLYFEKCNVNENTKKVGIVKSNKPLPISEYSYFILTLFMPLLFEDINTKLDYTVFLTLLVLIIIIFTKNDYIIINPLFLLGNFKVYKINMESAEVSIEGYAIVSKKIDLDKKVYYKKIFNNVYFIFDEYSKNETKC